MAGKVFGKGTKSVKPNQVHHFATDKNSQFIPQFEKIASKYKLDLNNNWNKASMPHGGRHPNDYHRYILDRMDNIDKIARGKQSVFLSEFEKVKQVVINNPAMLTKKYWL